MKYLEKFIAVVAIILLLPFIFLGITSAREQDYTQTAPLATTAIGNNTADVTLIKDLFDDDLTAVTSIISTNSDDAPAVLAYNSADNHLTITGLEENSTRTLSVAYAYARMSGPADMLFSNLGLLIAIGVFVVVGLSWWASRRGK